MGMRWRACVLAGNRLFCVCDAEGAPKGKVECQADRATDLTRNKLMGLDPSQNMLSKCVCVCVCVFVTHVLDHT